MKKHNPMHEEMAEACRRASRKVYVPQKNQTKSNNQTTITPKKDQ